jgi:hypothetical protein
MKIAYQKQRRQQGSFMMFALFFGVILTITLGSYLVMVSTQDKSVVRSEHWNSSLTLAEAGVEEALAQMNASPNDFSANNWGMSGGNYGPVTRTMGTGSYGVAIVPGSIPTIYSTGYVTVPITGTILSRKVKVTAQNQPLINVPLGAVGNINMNGNSAATDSWNSHDPNLSNNGAYTSSKTSTNGSVASVDGIVNIGNHTIEGNLYLGPTATYTSGSNQVTGTIYSDYNVQFPDAVLPTVSWLPAVAVSGAYDFTVSGNYVVTDSKNITVEPGVTVTLKLTATSFNPSSITINGGLTNSGTLTMYQVSGTASMSGNSAPNVTRPQNFYYYGLPGVTSITLSGNSTFIGVIYAPEASLTLNGGGNSNNLEGAAIINTVTLNGHYDFHYDESLATNGPSRGFIATSWQEL